MSLAGTGVVAIWHDIASEAKDAFYEWHNREHMPERAAVPGFLRGRRYIALSGTPEYFNLYEAQTPDVLGGSEYLARLNAPTPWTQQVVASFRNVARSTCRVLYSGGVGQGGVMLTLRFDVEASARERIADAFGTRLLPPLLDRVGIAGVHLCLADEATSKIETAEKRARASATAVPMWIVLVEGISAKAVGSAAAVLEAAMRAEGLNAAPVRSIYQLEHARCKTPGSAG